MKRKILISILFVLCFQLAFNYSKTINALASGIDATGKASYLVTKSNITQINENYASRFYDEYGTIGGKEIHVTLLDQLCDGSKKREVVSWVMKNSTNDGFKRGTVAEIAADYEKNHSGYIVLGGINADQYTLGYGTGLGTNGKHPYTVQPYYPLVIDGEKIFSNTWMNSGKGSAGMFVGFTNESGSNDQLCEVVASATNAQTTLTLQVLNDNGEVLNTFPIDSFNGEGETILYSAYYSDIDLGTLIKTTANAENLFVVEAAEIAYCNNNSTYTAVDKAQDAFFGKGTISSITKTYTLGKAQFAISTTNSELLQILKVGSRIRCQYEYVNETVNSFKSTTGFHTVQKTNNVDNAVSGSYNTNNRPRSVFGRRVDGSIVLMTIDDYNNSYGTTGYGINAICAAYNITEAYQMDGGGSAQMAVRQKDGSFKAVTYCDDRSAGEVNSTVPQRKIFSALLFIVRDPSIPIEYNVEYIMNGGSWGEQAPKNKYTSIVDLEINSPERAGYVFVNWYLDDKFTKKINIKVTGDIVLYAKWLLLGDFDRNEKVDLVDCIRLRIAINDKHTFSNDEKYICDLNEDGKIDETDVMKLQEKLIS